MIDLIFPGMLLLLWAGVRITLPDVQYDLDFDQAHATFMLLLDKYLWVTRTMVVIDFLLALLPSSRLVSNMPVHCCIAGMVCGILFSVWILSQYEVYLHVRYPRGSGPLGPSTYSAGKRAVTMALGWGTVLFTIIGLVVALA